MSSGPPRGVSISEAYDPFASEVIANPYPPYARLLDCDTPVLLPRYNLWVLARHRHVWEGARAHDRLSSAEGVAYQRMKLQMMLTMDPPDHTRLRKIVARDFSPRAVESWAGKIEQLAVDAIDPLVGSGRFDFVDAVAGPFPVMVIATVLGIPPEDHAKFRSWSDALVEGFRPGRADHEWRISPVTQPVLELQVYLAGLIEQRRERPRDDLVTKLLQPSADGRLSETELLWFLLLLLVAGNETTTGLLGNMLVAFATHPEQWALLRARPDLVPLAVEEVLRYDAPIQGFFRTATQPCQIGGASIPRGARCLLLFGAANRDPARYPEPDRFLIERNPTDHLAFGAGIHYCLGAALARLEAAVLLRLLAKRVAVARLTGDPERTTDPTLRGFRRLPVEFLASVMPELNESH